MNPGTSVVASYVPAVVAEIVSGAEAGPPWGRMIEGTLVMADVSGFTAMSERLAQAGHEGAERLTGIINHFFEGKLETARSYGGDVLMFGGDAILLLFRGDRHAERAVSAAWKMLQETRNMPGVKLPGGNIKLSMSVGAHSGPSLLAAAGLPEERMQLFAIGDTAAETAAAEAQADRGQLVVTTATAALLPAGWHLEEESGRMRVTSGRPLSPERETGAGGRDEGAGRPEASAERLLAFAPPPVRDAYLAGASPEVMLPEHRRVSVVFVRVLGLNRMLREAGVSPVLAELQRTAAEVVGLAAKHRGFLVSTDMDTKGLKLILAFGAPVAHEFSAVNAARFAMELRECHAAPSDLEYQIGVAGGRVFAGDLGPVWRRQYTVMGDEVNLAARLMASSDPGTVLAPSAWAEQSGGDLCVEQRAPIRVKGKADEIPICVLRSEDRETAGPVTRRRTPLLGRGPELEMFQRMWAEARAGAGRALAVSGDAGVGKSRFVDEAIAKVCRPAEPAEGPRSARGTEAPGTQGPQPAPQVIRAHCQEHLQGVPFAPWIEVLTSVMGLGPGQDAGERTAAAGAALERLAPGMAEFGSLLNPLLGVAFPMAEVVSSLDVQSRRQRLVDLMVRAIAGSCPPGGSILFIDDLHWADDSSLDVALELAASLPGRPMLLLLSHRPADRLARLIEGATALALRELTFEDSVEFVRTVLEAPDLPEAIVAAIHAKTRGNPLFLEEVAYSLRAPGVLERILDASSISQAAELAALAVPDRVQGLLMSRVDAAPPVERSLLKLAAVIGQEFAMGTLEALAAQMDPSLAVGRTLASLLQAAMIVRSPGDSYRFQHTLLQEVTYESLPFQRRREIHAQVAAVLERAGEHPDHGVLVHHYRHAGDSEQTRTHAVRASETSQAVYAFQEAADYLKIALETAQASTPEHASLRSRLEELTADCLESLGRHDEAVDFYVRARRRWESPLCRAAAPSALATIAPVTDPEARESDLCWKVARCVEREHKGYRRALRWLQAAEESLPPGRDELASRLQVTRGVIFFRLGDLQRSLASCEQGLALAGRGEKGTRAYALSMLAQPLIGLSLFDRAVDVIKESVALYEEVGDLAGQAAGHGNLAACYQYLGDPRLSLHHHELSLELYHRLSYRTGESIGHNNIAEVLLQLGRTEEAIGHLQQVVDRWEERKTPPALVGFVLVNMSKALLRGQAFAEAEAALDQGSKILSDIGAEGLLMEADLQRARLLLAQGRPGESEAACRKLLETARNSGARLTEAQALCLAGSARSEVGDRQTARELLQEAVWLAAELGAEYEKALALVALAKAMAGSPGQSETAAGEPLEEAIGLFEKMGAEHDLREARSYRDSSAGC